MSENIITNDLPRPSITLTLKETGAAVTAQQAYDAFMSGPVLITAPNGVCYSVLSMYWEDINAESNDPSNVKGVIFLVSNEAHKGSITVGQISKS